MFKKLLIIQILIVPAFLNSCKSVEIRKDNIQRDKDKTIEFKTDIKNFQSPTNGVLRTNGVEVEHK